MLRYVILLVPLLALACNLDFANEPLPPSTLDGQEDLGDGDVVDEKPSDQFDEADTDVFEDDAEAPCLCKAGQRCCLVAGALGCIDVRESVSHCGACEQPCAADESCVDGVCTCPKDSTRCAGRCRDLQLDEQHCGDCAHACADAESCVGGLCLCAELPCDDGQRCCEGACTDLSSDGGHCGACSNPCLATEQCCAGLCVDTSRDSAHCGACGDACEDGSSCCDSRCHQAGTGCDGAGPQRCVNGELVDDCQTCGCPVAEMACHEDACRYEANCLGLETAGTNKNGIYWIQPPASNEPFQVYCDMQTAGGGWTSMVHVSAPSQLNYSLPHSELAVSSGHQFWRLGKQAGVSYSFSQTSYHAIGSSAAASGWTWNGVPWGNASNCNHWSQYIVLYQTASEREGNPMYSPGMSMPASIDGASTTTQSLLGVAPVTRYPAVHIGCVGMNVLRDPIVWLR